MAEVVAFRNNVYGFPMQGAPWVAQFEIRDSNGALVIGATGLDSEYSRAGDTWADCTNEATEIGTSGVYYLVLTGTEMSYNAVAVRVQCNEAETIILHFFPEKYVDLLYDNTGGLTGTSDDEFILPASCTSGPASILDQAYTGGYIEATIDGVHQARQIYLYDGATRTVYLWEGFTATPDSDDPWAIKIPQGMMTQLDATMVADALLRRDWTAVATPADRSLLQAARFLRNKWDATGGVLTVKKEDDSTTAWTSVLTGAPGADPVSGSDPT